MASPLHGGRGILLFTPNHIPNLDCGGLFGKKPHKQLWWRGSNLDLDHGKVLKSSQALSWSGANTLTSTRVLWVSVRFLWSLQGPLIWTRCIFILVHIHINACAWQNITTLLVSHHNHPSKSKICWKYLSWNYTIKTTIKQPYSIFFKNLFDRFFKYTLL